MRLHETSPDEPLLAAEYARLSLVLDRNAKEGQRVAQEAFNQAPGEPFCAAAQALSLYSLGRAAEGIDLLKKLPPEKSHEPHTAVYMAVLLLDQGQFDAAREFIDTANAGSVFAEERKLLQDALQKTQSTPVPSPSATTNVMPSPTPVDLSPR
jgi:Flp pilus assembly protein TadD